MQHDKVHTLLIVQHVLNIVTHSICGLSGITAAGWSVKVAFRLLAEIGRFGKQTFNVQIDRPAQLFAQVRLNSVLGLTRGTFQSRGDL